MSPAMAILLVSCCKRSVARLLQLPIEVRLHRRPFGGDDAVDAGVAQGPVGADPVAPQDAVKRGAQPLDAASALEIEEVRAELDCDTAERLEGVGEQQQLAVGVEVGALHAAAVPGRADLHALVGRIDVHVRRHAGGSADSVVNGGKGQHGAGGLQAEPPFDLGRHLLGRWNERIPQVPQLTVTDGLDQVVVVALRQRLQRNACAAERDGFRPWHVRSILAVRREHHSRPAFAAPPPCAAGASAPRAMAAITRAAPASLGSPIASLRYSDETASAATGTAAVASPASQVSTCGRPRYHSHRHTTLDASAYQVPSAHIPTGTERSEE